MIQQLQVIHNPCHTIVSGWKIRRTNCNQQLQTHPERLNVTCTTLPRAYTFAVKQAYKRPHVVIKEINDKRSNERSVLAVS